ncbi:glycosyltransferase family 4 protein [Salinarimonas soli]|nr:glycosyltransferase family 4 protein [Salinarimonas soli]
MARITLICPTHTRFSLADWGTAALGGIETTTIELARALTARGHRLVVATRQEAGPIEVDGVLNVPLADAGRHPADLFVSSNDPGPLGAAPAGARRVLWLHNPLALEKAVRRRYIGALVRLRPDAVFVGTVARAAMSRLYPFASRTVIPHGVSDIFRQAAPTDGSSRRFVWASQRQRGLEPTLDAWKRNGELRAARAELHVYGTAASEVGWTPEEARAAGVVFHPRQDQAGLAAAYSGARAMIYPGAHDETFCLAAAEAQAMGLPVVTLGIGSLSERVQHGVNGLVANSYGELLALSAHLARDDSLWRLLHAGAGHQRDLLTWDRSARLWEAFLLGGSRDDAEDERKP